MKILYNNKDNKKALLLALNDEDKEVLRALYDDDIVFGLYQIWTMPENKIIPDVPANADIKFLVSKLPNLVGVGWLYISKGFVGNKVKEIG